MHGMGPLVSGAGAILDREFEHSVLCGKMAHNILLSQSIISS